MPSPKVSQAEFVRMFEELGGHEMGRRLKMTQENVQGRRRRIEQRIGRTIHGPDRKGLSVRPIIHHDHRAVIEVWDGQVIIGSDAH